MATLTITWNDFNIDEDGFNIYRSESPMDTNDMPEPIATLDANIGSYSDTDGVVGTRYYYRIGVFRGSTEVISNELVRVFDDTINIHDIFYDDSALATYKFDDNIDDISGNFNLEYTGTDTLLLSNGVIGNAWEISSENTNSFLRTPFSYDSTDINFSFWFYYVDNKRACILAFDDYDVGLWMEDTTGRFYLVAGEFDNNPFDMSLIPNTWYHFSINSSPQSETVEFYLNGESYLSGTRPSSMSVNELRIGGRDSRYEDQGPPQGTKYDQLRIFNRLLTEQEIEILYNERGDS